MHSALGKWSSARSRMHWAKSCAVRRVVTFTLRRGRLASRNTNRFAVPRSLGRTDSLLESRRYVGDTKLKIVGGALSGKSYTPDDISPRIRDCLDERGTFVTL